MFVVTGAQGFIGSMMISYLNNMGIMDIVAIDDFEVDRQRGYAIRANYTNLQRCRFAGVHPISIDDTDILPLGNIEGVFHFGAISNTLEKDADRIGYYNVTYTDVINRVCKDRNIPIVFSSTAAVYGNGTGPLNQYAESKLRSEHMISDYAVCLRLFNVYGTHEQHKGRMASVIFKWFNELKDTGEIKIFENSHSYVRDFVYVNDVCKVAFNAIRNYKAGVYDLGSGTSKSFEDVADRVIRVCGFGKKQYIPMPADLAQQYQTNTVANIQPLIENNWIYQTDDFISLDNGIQLYWDDFKKENAI